eukprot:g31390.t1
MVIGFMRAKDIDSLSNVGKKSEDVIKVSQDVGDLYDISAKIILIMVLVYDPNAPRWKSIQMNMNIQPISDKSITTLAHRAV